MKANIGAVVKGGTSVGYITGNWRLERPEIDDESCVSCGICGRVCPDSAVVALAVEGSKKPRYEIDYRFCKGCGLCAAECPEEAITMVAEEK